VVAVSWVQFQTGTVLDLRAISHACRRHGAWLVVDAIQGLGVMPFDLLQLGVDAVCGGTHKWLCGPLGQGFLALAPGRAAELAPLLHGAMTYGTPEDAVDPSRPPRPDARRFEPGSPPLLSAAGAAAAIERLLSLGIENIHRAALANSDRLITGLLTRGARLLVPVGNTLRSPIVTCIPRGNLDAIAAKLTARHVAFARRGGGIRLSPHAFHHAGDVERFFAILDAA
jgi:cysteine desulfurase/selenocysteine lyase